MDEPTNDLDSDTLEMLEEMLTEYDGAVLLASHERQFLGNIVRAPSYLKAVQLSPNTWKDTTTG